MWGEGFYNPHDGRCLERDLDYPDETSVCTFSTPAEVMDVITNDRYNKFRSGLEGKPHAYPHICIGGDASTHMPTYSSPDSAPLLRGLHLGAVAGLLQLRGRQRDERQR